MKIFIAVADEGSFSKAAEKLGYVQSNITVRIKKLESELGVELFKRYNKGVLLTERGSLFYEHCSAILKRTEQAIATIKESETYGGELSIGVVETVVSNNFMESLAEFKKEHPNVSVSLITGTSPELQEKVLKYKIDAAFVTGDSRVDALEYEFCIVDEVALVSKTILENYHNHTWAVFPRGCPFRNLLEEWLEENNIKKSNFIEINTLDTMLNCVKAGLASTILPISMLSWSQIDNYFTVSLPEKYGTIQTCLVRRKDLQNKVLSSFITKIKKNHD